VDEAGTLDFEPVDDARRDPLEPDVPDSLFVPEDDESVVPEEELPLDSPDGVLDVDDEEAVEEEPAGAGVGAIEAAALEDNPDGTELLPQRPRALGAYGQGVVTEGLNDVEPVTAVGTGIGIGRHERPFTWWHPRGWIGCRV
jgi:hypothetical protein